MSRYLIAMMILCVAMLAGCEKKTGASDAARAQKAKAEAADRAAVDAKAAADAKIAANQRAATDAKAAADQAAVDTKAAADAKIAADIKAADDAKDAADQAAADAKVAAEVDVKTDENAAKATDLLVQLRRHVADNKLDLADATLAQLDAMKGTIPASLQTQVESARSALNTKKTAASLLE